jgi:acetyl-CoA synthetase
MTEATLHEPSAETRAHALLGADGYEKMYAASIADPDAFWGEHGRRIDLPASRRRESAFAWTQRGTAGGNHLGRRDTRYR